MKKLALVLFLTAVAVVAFSIWLPDNPQDRIARSETFAKRLEKAKRIDPETTQTIADLAASMRAAGTQADPKWENRRQLAIKRLENLFSTGTASRPTSEFSSSTKR